VIVIWRVVVCRKSLARSLAQAETASFKLHLHIFTKQVIKIFLDILAPLAIRRFLVERERLSFHQHEREALRVISFPNEATLYLDFPQCFSPPSRGHTASTIRRRACNKFRWGMF
jgi:hypothetical protein